MLTNLNSSEILDLLFDENISQIIFYDTCSFSKHALEYKEEGFPIVEWFNSKQLVIVTNIIDYELKEKNLEGELRERYKDYLELLQSNVKEILILDINTILDMFYDYFEEEEAKNRILYFLEGISEQNGRFYYLVKKLKLNKATFNIDAKKIVAEIFHNKEYTNVGEYSILFACLGLRLLDISKIIYILTDNTNDVELISAPFTDCHSEKGCRNQIQLLRKHFSSLLNDSNILRFYSTVRMLSELIQNKWNKKQRDHLVDVCAFYEIGGRFTQYFMRQDGEQSDQKLEKKFEPDIFVTVNIDKHIVVQY